MFLFINITIVIIIMLILLLLLLLLLLFVLLFLLLLFLLLFSLLNKNVAQWAAQMSKYQDKLVNKMCKIELPIGQNTNRSCSTKCGSQMSKDQDKLVNKIGPLLPRYRNTRTSWLAKCDPLHLGSPASKILANQLVCVFRPLGRPGGGGVRLLIEVRCSFACFL